MARTITRRPDDEAAAQDDGEAAADPLPARRLTRLRRLPVIAAAAVILVAGVTAAVVTSGREGSGAGAGAEASGGATAEAQRRTLTATQEVEGLLGFGDARSLTARSNGTVTSIAEAGSVVERNGELFSVDRQPAVLLTGELPMFRDLEVGVEGPDVAQLELNLVALGYTEGDTLTVDGTFDATTEAAVQAWQEDRGLEATGRVAQDEVVFLPGSVRVANELVDVGAAVQPGTPVLEHTSPDQVVQVELPLADADLADVDDPVQVNLPDGTVIDGTVASVSDAGASSAGAEGADGGAGAGGGGNGGDAAVEMTITLDDPDAVDATATAVVDVSFVRSEREDVLTVPVTALLALLGGGYAVEVPVAGGAGEAATQLVEVDIGMFADGFVEVEGAGLDEGAEVVVPE